MENCYKSALEKIKLDQSEKDKAKELFFSDQETGRKSGRKKYCMLKPAAVFAAMAALILAANALRGYFGSEVLDAGESGEFVITAYAQELTKTGQVYTKQLEAGSGGMAGNSEEISFAFWFPLECRGKNIDTVTYTIQNGAFQITAPAGRSPVVAGEEPDVPIEASSSFLLAGDQNETRQYRSFTVDYKKQSNAETSIEVVDASARWEPEKRRQYQAFGFEFSDQKNVELEKEVCDFLTKDLGISCTVTFLDGTTKTKEIAVSNKIVMMSQIHDLPEEEDFGIVVRYFSLQ